MEKKRLTQEQIVVNTLREVGGYATLKRLNELIDFSTWGTKTPEASVRRIVQLSNRIFKIQSGLWALEEERENVLRKFDIKVGNRQSEEQFTHGYYQGLLVEIGKFQHLKTYVPAQDKNRLFIDKRLGEISDMLELPDFTYDDIKRKARTVDVIWFNSRNMPSDFYEVEHTTDIKNSLSKFYELQDLNAGFYIVADKNRKKEYEDKLHVSLFDAIENRVKFLDYNRVVSLYEGMKKIDTSMW